MGGKTTYKTTFKTLSPVQVRQRQIAYETETGVKWDVYSTGSGTHLVPIVTRNTPIVELEAARQLLTYLPDDRLAGGMAFMPLVERSGLPLATVLGMAQMLVRNGLAYPTINRNGNFHGLYKRMGDTK